MDKVYTDQPGIQIYTGNHFDGRLACKAVYAMRNMQVSASKHGDSPTQSIAAIFGLYCKKEHGVCLKDDIPVSSDRSRKGNGK